MGIKLVKEDPRFVRDTSTGAIINTSKTSYEEFIERRKKKLLEKKRLENAEKRLNILEDKIDKILSILEK